MLKFGQKEVIPEDEKKKTDHFRTQEMRNEEVRIVPLSLAYVPAHFKTQEMCNETVG